MPRTVVHIEKMELIDSMDEKSAPGKACHVMVDSLSPDMEQKLLDAYQWNDEVTLRYSTIDVHGMIRKVRYAGVGKAFFLEIDGIDYQTLNAHTRCLADA